MSEDLVALVAQEVSRIQQLALAEQPEEFARLRDQLEQALESFETTQGE